MRQVPYLEMMLNWPEYATRQIGKWQLHSLLGERNGRAFFLGSNPAGPSRALVQIVPSDDPHVDTVRAAWEVAQGLSSPRLVRVYDSGEASLDGTPVTYAAME